MKALVIAATALLLASCGARGSGGLSDAEIDRWCEASGWFSELPAAPAAATDRREFVRQNGLRPEEWKAAFEFLSRRDLASLAEGDYTLDDKGTFASVSGYETRDTALFEAHRRYVDIQYVVSGAERIDIADAEVVRSHAVPYDEGRDIEFFAADRYRSVEADSSRLVVLFPADGHRPCMSTGEPARVKKIVVKIPYEK